MGIITVNGQRGSYGTEISRRLAAQLGIEWLDKESIFKQYFVGRVPENQLKMLDQSPKFYQNASPFDCSFQEYLEGQLRDKGKREDFLILGFAGAQFLHKHESAMHIKIVCPLSVRCERVSAENHISWQAAELELSQAERKYQRFLSTVFGADAESEGTYDLIMSSEHATLQGLLQTASAFYEDLQTTIRLRQSHANTKAQLVMANMPVMKNQSEIEFAHMLDLYKIDWRYEPKTFPVEWDEEGRVTLAFSPDFYLPRFNLYLELTTMNQKYVTMKNKKAKKLRELYPGINVRIVYKKDFASMMERFERPD